jgi:hypothetical protein
MVFFFPSSPRQDRPFYEFCAAVKRGALKLQGEQSKGDDHEEWRIFLDGNVPDLFIYLFIVQFTLCCQGSEIKEAAMQLEW